MNEFYRKDEREVVAYLLAQIHQSPDQKIKIAQTARKLIEGVRAQKAKSYSIESLLKAYDLSSQEGLVLMCLTEALLRVPDSHTKTRLIRDKISSVSWDTKSSDPSFLTRLSSLGLAATGQLMTWGLEPKGFMDVLGGMTRRLSEPVIRQTMAQAMKIMGHQFVMGETIAKAVARARPLEKEGYRFSYDMLGEGARTQVDADRYYQSYHLAIEAIGKAQGSEAQNTDITSRPSISVKLSAIHPRYEFAHRERILTELTPKVIALCQMAQAQGIALTIDAEETERLDLSLDLMDMVLADISLNGWQGLGLAVQAYQKRAPFVIDFVIDMAKRHKRQICVRLVKGAYWDSEIKRTQEKGLNGYPVFTCKSYTDVCYQVCAEKMLAAPKEIYAQFATHNAQTLAMVLELAGDNRGYEFQRLHGMGEALCDQIVGEKGMNIPCRVYAPVGEHRDLLPYLVRRLLENGANSSFVNKIQDKSISMDVLTADPVEIVQSLGGEPHDKILLPIALLPGRVNSRGLDLNDQGEVDKVEQGIQVAKKRIPWVSMPIIGGKTVQRGEAIELVNPANNAEIVARTWGATAQDADTAMTQATKAFEAWSSTSVEVRAQALERWSDLLEAHTPELMAILSWEGGKTLADGISEVREAVDYCRYYAQEARRQMAQPMDLPGPTGEVNQLSLHGRGVFVCISPWNFPMAIFLGQVAAALAAGNCVLAKPAQQTPTIAYRVIQLAHEAGIPGDVLHYLPGKGSVLGAQLMADNRTSGVAFTGSTAVAQFIAKTLISRDNAPIVPLIAETGGMNAMIVDSSALPEQVVQDVIISSCQSAGQRCSALRLLFIQDDIANDVLTMLAGAMAELTLGDPSLLSTDVGPVIDRAAQQQLTAYAVSLEGKARLIYSVVLDPEHDRGSYVAPQAWEIPEASFMKEEVFGPILHVVRYKAHELDQVVDAINATGYGLTLGLHSRIDETIDRVRQRARVGNFYVNRSIIGAVVGVQPFGGEGFSGTGPKAGGPHYLTRFTVERTFTQDTTAAGGNASLLASL